MARENAAGGSLDLCTGGEHNAPKGTCAPPASLRPVSLDPRDELFGDSCLGTAIDAAYPGRIRAELIPRRTCPGVIRSAVLVELGSA